MPRVARSSCGPGQRQNCQTTQPTTLKHTLARRAAAGARNELRGFRGRNCLLAGSSEHGGKHPAPWRSPRSRTSRMLTPCSGWPSRRGLSLDWHAHFWSRMMSRPRNITRAWRPTSATVPKRRSSQPLRIAKTCLPERQAMSGLNIGALHLLRAAARVAVMRNQQAPFAMLGALPKEEGESNKFSAVLDPTDEGAFKILPMDRVAHFRSIHVEVTGDEPLPVARPIRSQPCSQRSCWAKSPWWTSPCSDLVGTASRAR